MHDIFGHRRQAERRQAERRLARPPSAAVIAERPTAPAGATRPLAPEAAAVVRPFASGRSFARRLLRPELALALLTFILYLPLAVDAVRLGGDEVEYVDVARRLLAGDGYRLGIKAFHVGGPDVVHDGLAERPPLFTFLVAAVLGPGLGVTAVQVVNAALAAVCVGLVAALGAHLVGRRIGVLAGLLAAMSPPLREAAVRPMSEPQALALVLAALVLILRAERDPGLGLWGAAGLALGLAYLTRPSLGALLPVALAGALVLPRGRRAACVAALLLGAALPIVPITLHAVATRGSLSYSGQDYLYAVFDDSDVLLQGYGRALPSPREFILANGTAVAGMIARHVAAYARLIFLDASWLLLLAPAWPLVGVALRRRECPPGSVLVLAFAATHFAVYALTWSTFQVRYQLLTMLLLLTFAVDGLDRLVRHLLGRRSAAGMSAPRLAAAVHAALVAAVALTWLPSLAREYGGEHRAEGRVVGAREDFGLRWSGPPDWIEDADLRDVVGWIRANAETDAVLALGEPWPYTFFTGRPSTLLPLGLDAPTLRRFVAEYRVSYVLVSGRDRRRRPYGEYLSALASDGVRQQAVGRYAVYATETLWR